MIQLSVIMPCWNSRGTLQRAIDALCAQDIPGGAFEIVVVDDGSTDGTFELVRSLEPPVPIQTVRQPNRGIAAARNLGASHARGEVLLFLDPDIFGHPGLVRAHLQHYGAGSEPAAVQGRTIPDPETLVTPFMRTSNLMPDLTIRRREHLSPLHVIGRNFSVRKAAFRSIGGFDEGFTGYGLEDVEFALRLHQAGGRIWYEPNAVGTHHHLLSLESAIARQQHNGRAAVHFWRKHGRPPWLALHFEIHPALLPLKWLVYRTGVVTRLVSAIRPWAERWDLLLVLNECHNHLLWCGYYQGVFQALGDRSLRARRVEVAPP